MIVVAILAADGRRVDLDAAEALVEKHPHKRWVRALYGDCLLRAGRAEEARDSYIEALSLGLAGRMKEKVLYNLTVAHLEMKRYDEAARVFDDLSEGLDRPLDDAERRLAGVVAYAQGDRRTAARCWRGLPPTMRRDVASVIGDEGPAFAGVR